MVASVPLIMYQEVFLVLSQEGLITLIQPRIRQAVVIVVGLGPAISAVLLVEIPVQILVQ